MPRKPTKTKKTSTVNKVNKMAGNMFDGSNSQTFRRSIITGTSFSNDFNNIVSQYDIDELRGIARFIYSNVGGVRQALREISSYAIGDAWYPEFKGQNQEWATEAKAYLDRWYYVCDVRGQNFDLQTDLFLASLSIDRDGDALCVLTKSRDGKYPMINWVPSHRIGCRNYNGVVGVDGPLKGLPVYSGVIYDTTMTRVMGYSIRGNKYDGSDDIAIEAKDCHLVYEADYLDQNRGISVIGSSATDLKDYRDFRDWERLAQKHASSVSMIEHNEIGGADPTETYFNASTGSLGLYMENVDGGSIRYFKANSGADLKPFTYDRPGANTNVFMTEHVLRHIFAGMEWPLELTWNTSLLGGPAARLVLAKAQRKIARRQAVIYKLWKRLITYAVAVGVKNKYLSFDPDWYKWEPTYPSVMTIDNGRDTKAELELYKIGSNNLSKISGAGGDDWKEVILQKIREQKFITEECKKEGVDPSTIVTAEKAKNPAVDPMKEQSDV